MSGNNKYSKLLDEWKSSTSKYQKNWKRKDVDDCFKAHIEKIKNDTMELKDYAGDGTNPNCTYLTTFLETKSRKIYGSARPGNMFNNGIYFSNADEYKDTPYFINENIDGYNDIDKKDTKKVEKQNKQRTYFKNEIAEKTFKTSILPFLKDIVLSGDLKVYKQIELEFYEKDNKEIRKPMGSTQLLRKIIAMNNIGKFLYIYSNEMINVLFKFFVTLEKNERTNIEKNRILTHRLKKLGFKKRDNENEADYIINLSHFIWDKFDSTIDINTKNTILHGAPGTGKTYMTEKSILNNLSILNDQDINKQYKLVQFHPSFGYEEFIDGIKPVMSNNNIQLELVNGIFKDMCIDAFKELIRFNKLTKDEQKKDEIKKFYFVADEINRAELSRVFGELLLCLEEDKRLKFDKEGSFVGTKIKTQNSSLWQKEHAVVILDNDNKIIDLDDNSDYTKDGNKYFGVPENLYFIGTMNDIDRSVDSFDMALRRRFTWKHYSYKKAVLEEHYDGKAGLAEYLEKCEALNNYIVSEKGFGLPESYMLGHSYFMNLYSFTDTQLKRLWSNKIEPLLIEYARINYEGKELRDKLECTKKLFLNQKSSEKCK